MKKIATVLSLVVLMGACKKKDSSPTPSTSSDPCKGKNLCFMLDGTQKSQNANWVIITGSNPRNRISWEEGSGTSYKNIEIDFYGDTAGTYSIVASPVAGQAGFQYYEAGGSANISGVSGSLKITKFDGTKVSGTFTCDAVDGAKTHKITEGNIVDVTK